ncbi:hypothetical protein [Alicyclobacillus fodiniaquatilis]|uniref:Uncharacterized protein n=1 Tax=Alicyclobacillus fodiniaquatilis TaxID=1661150 RepID=A0ABW4JLP3_9BACL
MKDKRVMGFYMQEIHGHLQQARINQNRENWEGIIRHRTVTNQDPSKRIQERVVRAETGLLSLQKVITNLLDLVQELSKEMDPFSSEYSEVEERIERSREVCKSVLKNTVPSVGEFDSPSLGVNEVERKDNGI